MEGTMQGFDLDAVFARRRAEFGDARMEITGGGGLSPTAPKLNVSSKSTGGAGRGGVEFDGVTYTDIYWGTRQKRGKRVATTFGDPANVAQMRLPNQAVDRLDDGTYGSQYLLRNRSDVIARMRRHNLISGRADPSEVSFWWRAAQAYSATAYKEGKKITPLQALKYLAQGMGSSGRGGGVGGVGGHTGPVTTTTTSTSVNLSTRGTAETIGDNVARDELGRELSQKEVTQLHRAINKAERRNPTRTRTTTRTSGGADPSRQSVTSTSTSEGGFDSSDAGQLAIRRVRNRNEKEWRRHRNQTTLLDALVEAISAPV